MWWLLGLPWWLSNKESTCQCRKQGLIPGSGRSPGEGNGKSLQYSCLGNHMDRAWRATVHGVTKSQTWLSDWTTSAKILNSIKDRQCSLTLHSHKHLVLCCWAGEISKWVHSWMSSEIIWTRTIMSHPSALLMFLYRRLFVLSAVDSISLSLFIYHCTGSSLLCLGFL